MLVSVLCLCAHMHTLIPEQAFLRKGRDVAIRYLYCHPFEHEVVTTEKPRELFVVSPRGTKEDLLPSLTKLKDGYRLRFTPKERGDHYLLVRAPVEKMANGGEYHRGAKLILHVQSQVGWDRPLGAGLDIVPLTRPYGLRPGCPFRARVTWNGKPVSDCSVEVEKYNAAPPTDLPDDSFVTAVVKTDAAGLFVAHLPESGWWSVTATVDVPGTPGTTAAPAVKHVLSFWLPVGLSR